MKKIMILVAVFFIPGISIHLAQTIISEEQKLLNVMHTINSEDLFNYVKEIASDKFEGRLTGTAAYDSSAAWLASQFLRFGINPGSDNGSYFQYFDVPYTLVFPDNEVALYIPGENGITKKYYSYESDYMPGSTSGSGEITGEVVYVGYGITAPELSYDDYSGVDVKGRIVLVEPEVPVSPFRAEAEEFQAWRPYSFHQYKLENAYKHGAAGLLYNYGPIANPNNSYIKGFIYSHVGQKIVEDVFAGTGKDHNELLEKINKDHQPASFNTGKTARIKNTTEYHPEGKGSNVIGIIEGDDETLKNEFILVGAHLDHMGKCHEIIPGANDNASAVAVMLAIAEALKDSSISLRRSVVFIGFGAEEQGVIGSKHYLENPVYPLQKTSCLLNMDGVGCGYIIGGITKKEYLPLWELVENINSKFIHRQIELDETKNLARPRLDAARFWDYKIPTISFYVSGAKSYYHITKDNIDTITPEIMEDLAQLLFLTICEISNSDTDEHSQTFNTHEN